MDVRVAIGTILAYVGENRLYVTERASHFFVHATKRVVGFVVIEFRDGTDGAPAGSGVAVFTRDGDRAMRVTRGLILRSREGASGMGSLGCGHAAWDGERQQCPESELEQRERYTLLTPRQGSPRRGVVEKFNTASAIA